MTINERYTNALQLAPAELKKLFRNYEDTLKKIVNTKWSITFNDVCVKENIVPEYVRNIYIYCSHMHTRNGRT